VVEEKLPKQEKEWLREENKYQAIKDKSINHFYQIKKKTEEVK
jgi:hypothetical protein